MITSAVRASFCAISLPIAVLRSIARLRLLRFALRNTAPGSPRKGGQRRVSSPITQGSSLMTSAPRSPRYWVQSGPARTLVKSSTRVPVIGFIVRPRDMLFRRCNYIAIRSTRVTRFNFIASHGGASSVRRRAGASQHLGGSPPKWEDRSEANAIDMACRIAPLLAGIDRFDEGGGVGKRQARRPDRSQQRVLRFLRQWRHFRHPDGGR